MDTHKSIVMGFAVVAVVGLASLVGCTIDFVNEDHCARRDGNKTCAELLGDEVEWSCMSPKEGCFPETVFGCLARAPETAQEMDCYRPCGASGGEGECEGIAGSGGSESGTGETGDGDGDGSSPECSISSPCAADEEADYKPSQPDPKPFEAPESPCNEECDEDCPGDPTIATHNNDCLEGSNANDYIFGRGGDDTVLGKSGNDRICGDSGFDTIHGDGGADIIFGGANVDIMFGGGGDDTLSGDASNDQIAGGDGKDLLYGGPGDDTLYGGIGNDILVGGAGNNRLHGGIDDDIYTWADNISFGNDTISDEGGNDTLWIGGASPDDLTSLRVANDLWIIWKDKYITIRDHYTGVGKIENIETECPCH